MSNEYLEPFFNPNYMKKLEQPSIPKVEQVATEITTQNLEQMVNTITEQERKNKIMSNIINGIYITIVPKQNYNQQIHFFWQVAKKNNDPRVNYGKDIILHKGAAKTYKRAFKNAWLYYQGFIASRDFVDITTENNGKTCAATSKGE